MRRTTPLLCLLALLAAPVHGVGVEYPAPAGEDSVAVDLVADAGQTIDWRLEVPEAMKTGGCLASLASQSDAQSAYATLSLDEDTRQVTLQRNVEQRDGPDGIESTVVFEGSLPVDDPGLSVGQWLLGLTVRDRHGAQYACGDDRELVVDADDDAPPVVNFPTAVGGVVRLGDHQSLALNVTDATLGRVEYRVDRMPPGTFFALSAPYVVKSQSFFPGENELTLRAVDRAGNAPTVATVKVVVDGDPPVLEVDLLNRTTFYSGIPNPIVVNVTDDSDYRVTVSFQGRDLVEEGEGGNETSTFRFGVPANATGEAQLQVRVLDAFGNRVSFSRLLTVTQLATDARIVEAKQASQRVVVGEEITIHLAMEQPEGLANVTFTLRLDGEEAGEMELPSRGTNQTTLTARLPPGRQTLTLRAIAPDGVLQDEDNLTAQVPVEVYLARVVVGSEEYHVRSTPQGLPDGVLAPNGTVLPVELVERGSSSVYAFQAGKETYHWDPSRPNVQDFEEAEPVDGGKESPGPGAVLVLGLLAVAVALRRR